MRFFIRSLVTLTLAAAPLAAQAQTGKWPEKAVRIITATAPGGGDDFVSRLIAPKLGEILGQPFIVENRPGAGGVIGQSAVANSSPDGYTWLLAGRSMAGARYVNSAVTYDVLRDFTPVSLLETSPFVMLVHPSVPARNVKEFVTLARSHPGKMTYGTIGAGQIPYWSVLLFNTMAGIKAVEIPYKGVGAALVDLMAGRIDYYFASMAAAATNKAKLRSLAVTSTTRSPAFPDVPTMAEAALPGYDMSAWRSIMGPAKLPRDIVASLNVAIRRTLAMPEIHKKLLNAGSTPAPSSPEELSRRYADSIEQFGRIAKQAGVKPQ
jgi:tripartite-type tricarboxylate transporter receptor subunit TctC